jgi:hypothetical protein
MYTHSETFCTNRKASQRRLRVRAAIPSELTDRPLDVDFDLDLGATLERCLL